MAIHRVFGPQKHEDIDLVFCGRKERHGDFDILAAVFIFGRGLSMFEGDVIDGDLGLVRKKRG